MEQKKKSPTIKTFLFFTLLVSIGKTHAKAPDICDLSDGLYSNCGNVTNLKTNPPAKESKICIDKEYVELAKSLKKDGETEKAIKYYKKALSINSKNFQANFALGGILYNQGKLDEALSYYKKASSINDSFPSVHFNISLCLIQKKNIDDAITYLKKCIEISPTYSKAYKQLGMLLNNYKRYEEAVVYFKKLLAINPESFDTLYILGRTLKNLDELEEASIYLKKAYDKKPHDMKITLELANTYNMMNENQESLDLYEKVLKRNPNLTHVKYNFGFTLKKMGHYKEAIKAYKEVLSQRNDYAKAHFSLGLIYLLLGNFDEGWKEYEWRWPAYKENPIKFKDKPFWDGSSVAGKRILLRAEQGLGDTFQFIRYAKIVKKMGAYVIVQAQRPLATVLSLCKYIDKVIPRGKPVPDFDCYAHLMSLPLLFKTRVDTIPDNVPYLQADPQLVQYWEEKLSGDKNFKIGICWQGNKGYRTQALRHTVAAKSMTLQQFEPLSKIPGVSLYSLQKTNGEEQLKETNFAVHTFGPDFDESHGRFMDTFAIIKNLDLVISIDTSICHVAGGLGVPVWNLLPDPADWRWMLDSHKTPWYPNMKLFRQHEFGDWKGVIQRVAEELCTLLHVDLNEKAEIYENNTKITKKPSSEVTFYPIKDMLFEELLDKLMILKIKYDETKDPVLLDKIKELEDMSQNFESIFVEKNETSHLDELTKQLYEINKQLFLVEKEIANLDDRSIFNKSFVDLTRKAQYIHQLKEHIKTQIKEEVKPQQ